MGTMKREGDMRSINLAKERPAGVDDTRVIVSHTDQKSRKNCKEISQKQTVSKENNLKQTTINPPAEDKLNDSDYQTPKVPLEESIYETIKVGGRIEGGIKIREEVRWPTIRPTKWR